MSRTMHLEVVSNEEQLYSDQASFIVVPTLLSRQFLKWWSEYSFCYAINPIRNAQWSAVHVSESSAIVLLFCIFDRVPACGVVFYYRMRLKVSSRSTVALCRHCINRLFIVD